MEGYFRRHIKVFCRTCSNYANVDNASLDYLIESIFNDKFTNPLRDEFLIEVIHARKQRMK